MNESNIVIIGSGIRLTIGQAKTINDGINNNDVSNWKKIGDRFVYETKMFRIFIDKEKKASIQLSTECREFKVENSELLAYFGIKDGHPDALKLTIQHPFYQTLFVEESA